jgi:hypothetical protein
MLKKLLVLGAIVAVIPMEREKQVELFELARAAIADMGGFCARNRDVCDKGSKVAGEVAGELAHKAEASARLVAGLAMDKALSGVNPDKLPNFQQAQTGAVDNYRLSVSGLSNAGAKNAGGASKDAAGKNPFYGYDPQPAGTLERLPVIDDNSSGTLSGADLEPAWGLQ